jgi:hypothetical protein
LLFFLRHFQVLYVVYVLLFNLIIVALSLSQCLFELIEFLSSSSFRVFPSSTLLFVLSFEVLMFSFPLKQLFRLFLDPFIEVLDLLFEFPLQVFDGVKVVPFLVFDLTRQFLLLRLTLLQLALEEFEFLLEQRLLLIELRLCGHP